MALDLFADIKKETLVALNKTIDAKKHALPRARKIFLAEDGPKEVVTHLVKIYSRDTKEDSLATSVLFAGLRRKKTKDSKSEAVFAMEQFAATSEDYGLLLAEWCSDGGPLAGLVSYEAGAKRGSKVVMTEALKDKLEEMRMGLPDSDDTPDEK